MLKYKYANVTSLVRNELTQRELQSLAYLAPPKQLGAFSGLDDSEEELFSRPLWTANPRQPCDICQYPSQCCHTFDECYP